MAFRNIFRNCKRAIIVLLSLFLSIATFTIITTLVSSIDIEKYVSSSVESDFLLENEALINYADRNQMFSDNIMQQISSLPYINKLSKTALNEINKNLARPIDLEAFDRGEFALIVTDTPYLFDKINEMEITCLPNKNRFSIKVGGFLPSSFNNFFDSVAPTIIVSNNLLQKYVEKPLIINVQLDVSEDSDEQTLIALKEIISEDNSISMISRLEVRKGIQDAQVLLYVLGIGISLILGIIGVLNFVNIMMVGMVVRRREFATLESIGMSRKQLRKMLVYEGVEYAGITIFLALIVGNILTFIVYYLLKKRVDYLTLSYPFAPLITLVCLIVVVCIITPTIAYRSVTKVSVIDRLREEE